MLLDTQNYLDQAETKKFQLLETQRHFNQVEKQLEGTHPIATFNLNLIAGDTLVDSGRSLNKQKNKRTQNRCEDFQRFY